MARPIAPTAVAGAVAAPAAAAAGDALWEFQRALMRQGVALSSGLAKTLPPSTSFGGAVHRMLKAAFLDADVYREASRNAALNAEAAIAAAFALLCAITGPAILGLFTGSLGLTFTLSLLGTQALFLAAFVATATLSAPYVVSKKIDAMGLFRPLAYAQSVAVLGVIPVVGPFFTLWRFVTMTAAIKDAEGVETGKAVLLLVVGIVGGAVVTAVLAPIVFGSQGGWGGFLR